MRVVFRADASVDIGTGHVMRCLALASLLRRRGTELLFVGQNLEGGLFDLIESWGIPTVKLNPGAGNFDWEVDARLAVEAIASRWGGVDWIVADHYGIEESWERAVRRVSSKILVIDDLADRRHDADLLVDQNLLDGFKERYSDLVPANCRKLLGASYAILRPEFRKARLACPLRHGNLRQILVFFGGTDPGNETAKALRGLQSLGTNHVTLVVIVGKSNPNRDELRTFQWGQAARRHGNAVA